MIVTISMVLVSPCSGLTASSVREAYENVLKEGISKYVELTREWSECPPPIVIEGTLNVSSYVAVYDGKEIVLKPGSIGAVRYENGSIETFQGALEPPADYLIAAVNDFETDAGDWPLPRLVVGCRGVPYVVYLGPDSLSVVNASSGRGVMYVRVDQPTGVCAVTWKDPGFEVVVDCSEGAVSVSVPEGTMEPAQGSSTTFSSIAGVQVSEDGVSTVGGPPVIVSSDGEVLFPTTDAVVSYLLSQALPDPSSLPGALGAALEALEDPDYVSTWAFLEELPEIADAVTPSWMESAPWVFDTVTVYPALTVTTAFLLAKVLATIARVLHATKEFLTFDDSLRPAPLIDLVGSVATEYILYYEEILLYYGFAKDLFYYLGLGYMWNGNYSPWDSLIPPLYEEWIKRICAAIFGLSPFETGIILGMIEFVNHVEAGWAEPVPGYLLDRVVIHGVLGSLPYVEAVALHAWCNWDYTDWTSVFAGVCAVATAWYEFEADERVRPPGWNEFEEALRGVKADLIDLVRRKGVPGGLRIPSSLGGPPGSGNPSGGCTGEPTRPGNPAGDVPRVPAADHPT